MKTWRIALLLALAVLTLGYRGTNVYMRYFNPDLSTRATFSAEYEDGHIVVHRVDATCGPVDPGDPACATHLHPGDRLVALYDDAGRGGEIAGLFDFGAYLVPIGATEPWTIVVDRPDAAGGAGRLTIAMPPAVPIEWSLKEWLVNLGYDVYLPLLAMATGLLLGLMRPANNQAFLAAIVFLGFSAAWRQQVSQFPVFVRDVALFVAVAAAVLAPYLILRFFLRFPRRSLLDRKLPWLSGTFLVISLLALVSKLAADFSLHYSFQAFERLEGAMAAAGLTQGLRGSFFEVFWGACLILGLTSLALNTFCSESRDDRRRMNLILAGAAGGLIPPIVIALTMRDGGPPVWLLLLSIPLLGLFPLSFVYAVVRHRVFGIRLILRRGLQYALVSRGFLLAEGVVIFLALFYAVGPILERLFPESGRNLASVGVAAVTVGLLAGTRKLNRRVLPAIDRRFFRDAYDSERVLSDLVHAVREMASRPDNLIARASDQIRNALHPGHFAIFLADRPWPRLPVPEGAEPACWEPAGTVGPERRFVAYVDRIESGRRAASGSAAAESRELTSRLSVSDLLRVAKEHGPEALDVLPTDAEASGLSTRPPDLPPGTCLWDRDLFHRYDARLVLPLVTAGKVLGFVVLGEKLSEEPYSVHDKALLLAVAEQMSIALDYSLLIGQVAEQEKLEREVQIAQDVQQRLLPRKLPPMRTLRYTGCCRPARGVGGDYYDFLPLGSGRLGIVVADIAGKGLPAALLMASLQALVRSQAPAKVDDLEGLADEVNRHLCETTDEARFATLFLAVYDDATRRLTYVNAGHNPPIVVRHGVGGEREFLRLRPHGTVVGVFEDKRFPAGEIVLEEGDALVVFTDGVSEAMNDGEELFGDDRLVDAVGRLADLPAPDIASGILDAVAEFAAGAPQQDDITLITARVGPAGNPA